jgi:hypothetical protein
MSLEIAQQARHQQGATGISCTQRKYPELVAKYLAAKFSSFIVTNINKLINNKIVT